MKPGHCMVTLRMPIDLKEQIQQRAKDDKLSMNNWLVAVVKEAANTKEAANENDGRQSI